MLNVEQAEARAGALIDAARRAGADAADVLYVGEASLGVQVRLGELEDVGRSEGEDIGLRLFVGSRSASVSSSDLSSEALSALVERAVAMAREAPEDPFAGLAPQDRLMRGAGPDVDGDRKSTRLNSSHANISYAVFCLKKKKRLTSQI